jgi:hypothetical protein
MVHDHSFSKEFEDGVVTAGNEARLETLRAGIPVFYLESDLNIMEMPGGRKFEIRFIPHDLDECNYEVVREIRSAA